MAYPGFFVQGKGFTEKKITIKIPESSTVYKPTAFYPSIGF